MQGLKQKFMESNNLFEKGWDLTASGVLICPHGHLIEDDGSCPEGCKSPLLKMGLI